MVNLNFTAMESIMKNKKAQPGGYGSVKNTAAQGKYDSVRELQQCGNRTTKQKTSSVHTTVRAPVPGATEKAIVIGASDRAIIV